MKTKLLRKLRRRASGEITILSTTRESGMIIGMSYSYDNNEYRNLFELGDTPEEVKRKATHIYIAKYIEEKRNGLWTKGGNQ